MHSNKGGTAITRPLLEFPVKGFFIFANKQNHGGTQKLYTCMEAFVYHYDEQRDRVKELHEVLIRGRKLKKGKEEKYEQRIS